MKYKHFPLSFSVTLNPVKHFLYPTWFRMGSAGGNRHDVSHYDLISPVTTEEERKLQWWRQSGEVQREWLIVVMMRTGRYHTTKKTQIESPVTRSAITTLPQIFSEGLWSSMANASLHRRSETDWTQPIFGLTGLPRGLPCLPFTSWCQQHVHWSLNMLRNITLNNESRLWLLQLDCRSKCGEDMQRAMPIAALLV